MNAASLPTVRELAKSKTYDAIVIGSGPNGLACAIAFQQAGNSVLVAEAQGTIGGGCRTLPLTIEGFKHDICAAVMPMGMQSPFFRTLPLTEHGLRWINPPAAYVHAFAPGEALVVERDLSATARNWSGADSYCELFAALVPDWDLLCEALLQPPHLVRYPFGLMKFGIKAMQSAERLARHNLTNVRSRAVFAGLAAHAAVPFDRTATASLGLALGVAAHAVGWPIPAGGAQSVTNALYQYFIQLGGEVLTGCRVNALAELPACNFLFMDVTPKQFLSIAGENAPRSVKRRYERYQYGPSVFKMDWALSAPIPWSSSDFSRAPTVHIGGLFEEIGISEAMVAKGQMAERPYVLLAQPSLFDDRRAPAGQHTVWAYCHVPYGSNDSRANIIENQIERFAPGFKERIIARSELNATRLQEMNENHIGGDINGGSLDFSQLLLRPIPRLIPYKTGLPNVYLCSSSTPPGSGVHGMCGYWAAWVAMQVGAKGRMAVPAS